MRTRRARTKVREAKAKAKEEMAARVRAQASKEEGLRHRDLLPRQDASSVMASTGRLNAPKIPSRRARPRSLNGRIGS